MLAATCRERAGAGLPDLPHTFHASFSLSPHWLLAFVKGGNAHKTEAVEKRYGFTEGREGKAGVGMDREWPMEEEDSPLSFFGRKLMAQACAEGNPGGCCPF